MEFTDTQKQWLQRIYDLAYDGSQNHELALSLASKLYNQTELNPNYDRPDGSGIAALPDGLEIDVTNPEESINYALARDINVYNQTGDVQAAIADSFITDENNDEAVKNSLLEIQDLVPFIQDLLNDDEDQTFTSIESPENRFRNAVRINDKAGKSNVIRELMNDRVSQRAAEQQEQVNA